MTLTENFLEERARWVLWLPVCLGFGIAIYFGLGHEPPLWPAVIVSVGFLSACFFRRHYLDMPLWLAVGVTALGLSMAALETRALRQPMLQDVREGQIITGRVMGLNRLAEGYRLLLDDVQMDGLALEQTPQTVRVKILHQKKEPALGAWISVKATLYPLSRPMEPDAFHFRRFAYFQGYAATGYAEYPWVEALGPPPSLIQRGLLFFQNIGRTINQHLWAHEEGRVRETAIAVALITGDQSGIDKNTMQSMRVAGISHILSVSGLHIAMVAGIVFYVLRAVMACMPWLALHWPIKKIAALAAIVIACFYTLICAAPIPAVRSLLMSGLVLFAIVVDRRALSMRLVALAAFFCLLVTPSALLDPSFQLSFGAVMALVAAFENKEQALLKNFERSSWLGRAWLYLLGSVLTSFIASFATAPLILYHFQQINWYGVLSNFIAVPLSSFIIMPAAVLVVLAIPFGLESWPLAVMHEGARLMIDVARLAENIPGAATYHPAMPFYAIGLVAGGGLWLCLWQRRWRWLGLIPFILGTFSFLVMPRPDIFVSEDAITLAARLDDGRLAVRAKNVEDFTVRTWAQRDGFYAYDFSHLVNWYEVAEHGGMPPLMCDGYDCVYHGARIIAFPATPTAMKKACADADIIIAPMADCAGKTNINRATLKQNGGVVIYDGGTKVRPVFEDGQGKRGWD